MIHNVVGSSVSTVCLTRSDIVIYFSVCGRGFVICEKGSRTSELLFIFLHTQVSNMCDLLRYVSTVQEKHSKGRVGDCGRVCMVVRGVEGWAGSSAGGLKAT